MVPIKNRLDIHVEKTENMVNYLLRKKRKHPEQFSTTTVPEALKSLFIVIVLLIDTLIPSRVFRMLSYPLNIVITLIILGIFLYIEIRLYNSLWGKKVDGQLRNIKNQ